MSLKPRGERAELVLRLDRQPHRELALRHPLQALLELVHRPDDEQEREVDQRDGAGDRERHQRQLDAAQQRRGLRDVALRASRPAGRRRRRSARTRARVTPDAPPAAIALELGLAAVPSPRSNSAKSAAMAVVSGTNSGRTGSPWRSVATTRSKSAMLPRDRGGRPRHAGSPCPTSCARYASR